MTARPLVPAAAACVLVAGGLALTHWPRVEAPGKVAPLAAGAAPSARPRPGSEFDELTQCWRAAPTEDARAPLRAQFEALLARSEPGAFARALSAGLWNETFFQVALLRWVEASPADALAWLHAWPERARFSHVYDAAATAWARLDPAAALQWTLRQPSDDHRAHLLARLAIGYAETDPALAAAFAAELLPPGSERQHATEGIAVAWAKQNPAAAATWAAGLEEPAVCREVVKLVLYSWFDHRPTAVEAWIRGLPDAGQRDSIRAQLVAWQSEKNPAEAAAVVATIADDAVRANAAVNLVRRWARDDFAVAGEWALLLPASPLRTRLVAELARVATEPPDERR